VIIINNLCKMVKNTKDASHFLPVLLPGLTHLEENAAFPEIRSLSKTAKETLVKVGGGSQESDTMDISLDNLKIESELDLVKKHLQQLIDSVDLFGNSHFMVSFEFACALVADLFRQRFFYKKEWQNILSLLNLPHLIDPAHKFFVDLDRSRHPEEGSDDAFDPDEGEELCNCDFSLAYGGMLLLNHTRLRLLRGRRYALLGNYCFFESDVS
jgi:elongation factor 3